MKEKGEGSCETTSGQSSLPPNSFHRQPVFIVGSSVSLWTAFHSTDDCMRLYHSLASNDAVRGVACLPPDRVSYLISAYYLVRYPGMQVACRELIKGARRVMLDSGMVSAMRAGELSWMERTEQLVRLARAFPFEAVVAMDIPTNPHLLSTSGLSVEEACEITARNAGVFLSRWTPQKKIFVLQGRSPADYEGMARNYESMGLFTHHEAKVGFAVGSLRGRRREDVLGIARICREVVPRRFSLHAFGIGAEELLVELSSLGYDSADCASASLAAACGRAISLQGRKRIRLSPANAGGRSALVAWNIAAISAGRSLACDDDLEKRAEVNYP